VPESNGAKRRGFLTLIAQINAVFFATDEHGLTLFLTLISQVTQDRESARGAREKN